MRRFDRRSQERIRRAGRSDAPGAWDADRGRDFPRRAGLVLAWRSQHPEPWTPEVELEDLPRFTGAIERWLDQGHGECLLRRLGCAENVAGALRFFEGQRTRVHAWVVMPNHIHVLTEILERRPRGPGIGLRYVGDPLRSVDGRTH